MVTLLILVIGGLIALGLWSSLARQHAPARSGRRTDGPLGARSASEIAERRAALEAEDLAQLLEAHNARRRRRGEPERTVAQIEWLVAMGRGDPPRRGESSLAAAELDQLLEATNARRRARGLPERTREDVRREYAAGS